MRKKTVKIMFEGIILTIGLFSISPIVGLLTVINPFVGLLYINHIKRDIFNYPVGNYLLESDIKSDILQKAKYSTVLVSNAPYLKKILEKNLKRISGNILL